MKKLFYLLIFLIFCNLNALEKEDFFYGVYGDYGINLINSDFGALPGIPNCCNKFDGGSGFAFGIGGVVYYKLNMLHPKLKLGTRLVYYNSKNNFSTIENETFSVDNQPYDGQYEHTLETNVNYINFYPLLEYEVAKKINVNFGLNLRIPINSNFSQQEKIINPVDRGVFEDTRTNIRNEKSGEIPELNPLASFLSIGLNYTIPLKKNYSWIAKPEIGFDYALSSNVNGINFYENRIKVGIEILYNYKYQQPPLPIISPPPPPIPIAVKKELTVPDIEFDFKGVDSLGREESILEITTTERYNFTLKPILTYVFFLENSSKIRKEYVDLNDKQVEKFDIDSVKHLPTMDIYYNVMNVVGKRLRQRPQSSITLIGCNSDENLELGNKTLSEKRAIAVRDYFINDWKINPDRIKIELRNLPSLPSNVNHNDGIVENRRVEIHSEDWEIVKPIIDEEYYSDFNIPRLKIYVNDKNKVKDLNWDLNVYFEGNNIFKKSGKNFNNDYFEINLDQFKFFIVGDEELEFDLNLTSHNGKSFNKKGKIPFTIVENPDEKETFIERSKYNLILFEFDKSRLTDANQKIVDIINNRIHPNSKGWAYAYTDRTGTEEHNLELSDRRAKSIVNYIKIKDIITEGRGESLLLYDNFFPEGRFYCRTTEIIVETEITR